MTISGLARFVGLAAVAALIAACTPAIGSEEWCNDLKQKPKGEWSVSEAADFAKHCLLR